jgi:hypothetical protein
MDKIELAWPRGTKLVFKNAKADQILTVVEGRE